MIGISLAYLPGNDFHEVSQTYFHLQDEFSLEACELHMECSQFAAAFHQADDRVLKDVREIRSRVKIMGVHLPYLDLNPLAGSPRVAEFAMHIYKEAIQTAASLQSDYVVFHARGGNELLAGASAADKRQSELSRWQQITAELSEYALAKGLSFCLENADDMRLITEIETILAASPNVSLCLDTGHLFERVYPEAAWQRLAGKIADRFLPPASLWGQGVPYYETNWEELLHRYLSRLRCIHLHNHNGKIAHCPVTQGKIDLKKMLAPVKKLADIPLILEADYRRGGISQVQSDLEYLTQTRGRFSCLRSPGDKRT